MQNNTTSKPELDQLVSDGQVVNRKYLENLGFKRSAVDYYLRSGKLVRVGNGAYRRRGPPLKWEHLLYSLQELGYNLHIGGKSALDLQGYVHYLPLGGLKIITLYGQNKPPAWLDEAGGESNFVFHKERCFEELPSEMFTEHLFGHWDWKLSLATVELALFELLCELKDEADFLVADKYFESATTLRPKLVNTLLLTCKQIKAKRLFLWFASRHNHAWFKAIETENVDLGSGKRVIVKGGKLDTTYQITIPKEMCHDADDFF